MLRARQHQNTLGGDAEPLPQSPREARAFGWSVSPDRQALPLDRVVDRLLKGLDGKAVDGRLAGGERENLGIRRVAEGVAQRRVARSQRRGGDFAAPRKRRAGRVGGRADKRAAADVAARSNPRDSSSRYALTTVVRLIRRRWASSRSGGTRDPDGKSPREIADSRRLTRCP